MPKGSLPLSNQPEDIRRCGLDAEALSGPEWFDSDRIQSKLAISFAWGTEASVRHVEAWDMTPGVFLLDDLLAVSTALSEPGIIVVAHNANYDLDLLNGTLLAHSLEPLPSGIMYQDTMNTLKIGRAYRNKLAHRCASLGVTLKTGSPDWLAVMQRKPYAWEAMVEYNKNDVVCTLQLERAYAEKGIPVPMWDPLESTCRHASLSIL